VRVSSPPWNLLLLTGEYSRKSDIENERLPPELFDADSEEGKAILSQPSTPAENAETPPPPVTPNGVAAGLEKAISSGSVPATLTNINTSPAHSPKSPSSLYSPTSPTSPASPSGTGFKRGHSRQASLGTTMTSPSTRRRSLESTMSLIQGVWDGKESRIAEGDEQVEGLADKLAGSSVAAAAAALNARSSSSR
jgi:serine/threonine-protein phosphatase 2B catalytic subunit